MKNTITTTTTRPIQDKPRIDRTMRIETKDEEMDGQIIEKVANEMMSGDFPRDLLNG